MNLTDFLTNKPEPEEVVEEFKAKSFSPFDFFKAMTIQKLDLDFSDEAIDKAYDQYMINRIISMDEYLIDVAIEMNQMKNLTNEQHYNMLKAVLPQEKFYNKYMKGKKDVSEKEKRYIAHYYEIGLREASTYIQQMSQEDIDEILKKYKYGKNEMIKV